MTNYRLFSSKKKVLFALFLLCAAIVFFEAAFLVLPYFSSGKLPPALSFEAYAGQVMTACQDAKYRPGCYDEEIPKLMDYISMEDAFEVTRMVQNQDDAYWYCHVLGHNLSARETAKDPGRWKDVIARSPRNMCSNGAIHGAFQERFRVDVLSDEQIMQLLPEFAEICEPRSNWRPTGMEQATCYHALGHLTMYTTGAEIKKSLGICNDVALKNDGRDYSQLCYDGAFMQIFQPLEPEDFALVEGKQPTLEEFDAFCEQFGGKQFGSCRSEGWPLFFDQIIKPEGTVKFCSVHTDRTEENRCYNALFYVLTAQFRLDPARVEEFCSELPQDRRSQCFANAASRFIETDARLIDRSVRLCATAGNFGAAEACYRELLFYSRYNFQVGSQNFTLLCDSLPSPWRTRCFEGDSTARPL